MGNRPYGRVVCVAVHDGERRGTSPIGHAGVTERCGVQQNSARERVVVADRGQSDRWNRLCNHWPRGQTHRRQGGDGLNNHTPINSQIHETTGVLGFVDMQ